MDYDVIDVLAPEDQPESKPTGKVRQIHYKLHPGEAGWLLKADKVVEF